MGQPINGFAAIVAAAMLAAVMPGAPQAGASCSENWVCVNPEAAANGAIDIVGRNLQAYPVTLTVQTRHRNLVAFPVAPVTVTLQPKSTQTILTLKPQNRNRETWYRYWFDWAVGDMHAKHDDNVQYRLPYQTGKRYSVLQGYGSRFSHTGLEKFTVDFNMPVGTPVLAARDGVVARVQEAHNKGCWEDHCGRYANFVVILHDDGTTGEYYHLQHMGALVETGDRVHRGQHIAYSGNTGHTTMPHLHFGVYRPVGWDDTESIPVVFDSRDGPVPKPRRGSGYYAR